MTSQGHVYARFRRGLDTRNATLALSAAAEMPHIGLADALELCLVLRDREPAKFERAALRWHGRYCRDVRGVGLQEGQAVLALLAAITGSNGKRAASALAELFEQRGELRRAAEVLGRWANGATR